MDWLTEKEQLINELNAYITGLTNNDPRPYELINGLLDILPYVQMANAGEFPQFREWWQRLQANACNPAHLPAQRQLANPGPCLHNGEGEK